MKHLLKLQAFFAASVIFLLSTFSDVNAQTQVARYAAMTSNTKAYYEYLPAGYGSGSQTYPVLIYVHGIAELGAGTSATLPKVLVNGPPNWISRGSFPTSFTVNGSVQRLIVISPQFVKNPSPADITGIIAYLKSHYRIDANRIYLTGISMGGAAVFNFAGASAANAKQVAAIVPICASVAPSMAKAKIMGDADLPVWTLHNIKDGVVPYSYSVNWVNYINATIPAPSPLAKKTIFPDPTHNAWGKGYNPGYRENGKNVYEWMLSYKRGAAVQTPNTAPAANAGADKAITLPANSVGLSGSASDDGTISRYAWSKIAGPTQFTISNAGISNPVISKLTAGTYTFRLTVTDNQGASGYNDMNIVVYPAPSSAPLPVKAIPGKVEAESYDAMAGIQKAATTDAGGGSCVGYIDKGDWFDYKANVSTAGYYTASFRVSSLNTGGQFFIRKADGTTLATINVPKTGNNQSWTTVNATINLPAGSQTLRILSNSTVAWNINWIQFTAQNSKRIPGKVEAESYNTMAGVQKAATTDAGGGSCVGYIAKGDWLEYQVFTGTAGNYVVSFRVSSLNTGAQFVLRRANGTTLATINVPRTGGNQVWTTVKATVNLPAGNETLRLTSNTSGANYTSSWNINWMEFVTSAATNDAITGQTITAEQEAIETIETGENASSGNVLSDRSSFRIFPNPVVNTFALQLNNSHTGPMKVQVIDMMGRVRKEYNLNKLQQLTQLSLSASELSEGTYFVRVQIGAWSNSQKIIKLK